jgi:hypothetical protein
MQLILGTEPTMTRRSLIATAALSLAGCVVDAAGLLTWHAFSQHRDRALQKRN